MAPKRSIPGFSTKDLLQRIWGGIVITNMHARKTHIGKGGFTLIELLIVIAIIGALASIVVVSLSGSTDKADNAVLESNFGQVERLVISLPTLRDIEADFCINDDDESTTKGASEREAVRKIIKSIDSAAADLTVSNASAFGSAGTNKDDKAAGCVSVAKKLAVWLSGKDKDGNDVVYCVDSTGVTNRKQTLEAAALDANDVTCAALGGA